MTAVVAPPSEPLLSLLRRPRASSEWARDVALATAVLTLGGAGLMRAQPQVMGSRIFLWDSLKVEKTKVGERRDVVRLPTATLDELEHGFRFNDAILRHLVVAMKKAETSPSPMLRQLQKEEARKAVSEPQQG